MSRVKKQFKSAGELGKFLSQNQLLNATVNTGAFMVEYDGKSEKEESLEAENAKLKAELAELEKVETPSADVEELKKENTVLKMQNGKLKKEVERANGVGANTSPPVLETDKK